MTFSLKSRLRQAILQLSFHETIKFFMQKQWKEKKERKKERELRSVGMVKN